jgi:integral membrane protein TIGR01906
MSNAQKDLFYTIALAFFILTSAITITIFASYALFAVDINHYYLTQAVGMKYSTIMKNYAQMMDYLINPFNWHFQLSDFASSAAGRLHFQDCKKLFLLNFGVFILTGIIVAKFHKVRARFSRIFFWIGIAGIVLAILMMLNFDEFFVVFHEVLFRNSDWLFDPSKDPVINILPEEFFTQCFILFFVLFEGLNFWKARKFHSKTA